MTTDFLRMQAVGSFRYREPELDLKMASEISSLYGTPDAWVSSPNINDRHTGATKFARFSMTQTATPEGRFEPRLSYDQQPASNDNSRRLHNDEPAQHPYADYGPGPPINTTAPLPPFDAPALYPTPSMFTATNANTHALDPVTVSPLQTRFNPDDSSPNSNDSFSYDGLPHPAEHSNFMHFSTDSQQTPFKRQSSSSQSSVDAHSPMAKQHSAGRRRRLEFAESGSARAVYLEKNRKAASKCRSKQKRQQEELVETARDVERKNRVLKAEVEILQAGMRELMDLVGQHTDCPDTRLRLYVEREADRLAAGGPRTSVLSPASRTALSHGMHSPETTSLSDKQ